MLVRMPVLLLLLLLTGCYASAVIHPGDIPRLDGYRVGEMVHLRTATGQVWPFERRTKIHLTLAGGQEVETWFGEIQIDGDRLRGVDRFGGVTEVRLQDIREFRVSRFSVGRTVAVGVVAAVTVPLALITASAVAAHNDW